jgi:phosphoglycerate dehydrogenase-like enzyme
MSRKIHVGITGDALDEKGRFLVPGPGLKLLDELQGVAWKVFPHYTPEVTAEQIEGMDVVVSLNPRWTEASLTADDRLLAVLRLGVGYDMVDVPLLTRKGVMLLITPEGVRRPMAMAIVTLILALATRLRIKDRLTREGRWAERIYHHGDGLAGKTLGSIGVGNIGRDLFRLIEPFGMRHLAFDPFVKEEGLREVNVKLADLPTVLAESDFVSINCPLSPKTRHLIGEAELRKMKKTAFLVNTARGPIVDEKALTQALEEGWIRGAGLDVFEQEPVSADNPLLRLENVIVAPHALGWTEDFFTGNWEQSVRQIGQIVAGKIPPEGLVNKEVLDTPAFAARARRLTTAAD